VQQIENVKMWRNKSTNDVDSRDWQIEDIRFAPDFWLVFVGGTGAYTRFGDGGETYWGVL
jgi:hypothetical protein